MIKDAYCVRCDVYKVRKWLERNKYHINYLKTKTYSTVVNDRDKRSLIMWFENACSDEKNVYILHLILWYMYMKLVPNWDEESAAFVKL